MALETGPRMVDAFIDNSPRGGCGRVHWDWRAQVRPWGRKSAPGAYWVTVRRPSGDVRGFCVREVLKRVILNPESAVECTSDPGDGGPKWLYLAIVEPEDAL